MTATTGGVLELVDGITGAELVVQEGESFDVNGRLADTQGQALAKASVSTFAFTLQDEDTAAVINSRSGTDALPFMSTDGSFRVLLDPADAAIVDGTLAALEIELHILTLVWTWTDGVTVRTGKVMIRHRIQKVI